MQAGNTREVGSRDERWIESFAGEHNLDIRVQTAVPCGRPAKGAGCSSPSRFDRHKRPLARQRGCSTPGATCQVSRSSARGRRLVPFGTSAMRSGGTLHVRITSCRPRSELTNTPAARRISRGRRERRTSPRRQMAVTNAADDPRPSGSRQDAVSARKPVDSVNHVGFVLLEQAAQLETASDVEAAMATDDGQRVAQLPHGLTIRIHARREANDSDGSPSCTTKLSEQLELSAARRRRSPNERRPQPPARDLLPQA